MALFPRLGRSPGGQEGGGGVGGKRSPKRASGRDAQADAAEARANGAPRSRNGLAALLRRVPRRARASDSPSKLEGDLRQEIRFYLEMRTEELIAEGMDPEEARRAAERAFGNTEEIVAECVEIDPEGEFHKRRGEMLHRLGEDTRYALRNLSQSPGFFAVAILTLAIGIGANSAIFSVVNGVLLNPLPYDEPDRLVAIYTYWTPESGYDFPKYAVGSPEYFDYKDQNKSMEEVAAVSTEPVSIWAGDGDPELVFGGWVSSSMFAVLRTPPLLGRTFLPSDDGPDPPLVFVISHGLWQRRFGGDPDIVGQRIDVGLDIETATTSGEIVGVMPEGFDFPYNDIEIWAPLALDRAREWRGGHWFHMIGRLADGVSLEEAQAEMATMMEQWAIEYPQHHVGHGLFAFPLIDDYVGDVRPALMVLLGAVGFVLLIACANVASLLMARGEARRREIAVRCALGAGGRRLLQQLLTESFLLATLGGLVGLLLAHWGVGLLLAAAQDTVPRAALVELDLRVLGFTAAAVLCAALVFGLLPALQVASSSAAEAFKDGGHWQSASRRRQRLRQLIVVTEVALAVLLVVGAGLMVKSFWTLVNQDPGFDPENLLEVRLSLPQVDYTPQQVDQFYRTLGERARTLPGVVSATVAGRAPLVTDWSQSRFFMLDRPNPNNENAGFQASRGGGDAHLFKTLRVPLIRGRMFDETDRPEGPFVVVIDEAMAERYWPGEDPLGKKIRFRMEDAPWHEIIGIVGNVKYDGLTIDAPRFYHYSPQMITWAEFATRIQSLIVRTEGNPMVVASLVRDIIRDLDPKLPTLAVRTMDQIRSRSVAHPRFLMLLLGVFAAVALILGAVGIYGVISFAVAKRTNEIGVRMALGAQGADVVGMVVRQGMILSLIGVALGLAGALAATRVMSGILYNVSTTDPWAFGIVSVVVVVVALLASYLPARRASRVDPAFALRSE